MAREEAGEEVTIARDGTPVARLTPVEKPRRRRLGAWAHLGRLQDPDLFLQPDPAIEAAAQACDEDEFYR